MWTDGQDSVFSFHASYAKNVQRKQVSGQHETDGSRRQIEARGTSGIFHK
jgi:hypothetical protein